MSRKDNNPEKMLMMRELIRRVAVTNPINHQEDGPATDEEVRDFIRIFLRPACLHNYRFSSYLLKHVAERAIGYIFHGSSNSCYVFHDKLKRIMREPEFASYNPRQCEGKDNEVYKFRFAVGVEGILEAFGVFGEQRPAIKDTV